MIYRQGTIAIVETPLRKRLTLSELKKARANNISGKVKKVYYSKDGYGTIFPMQNGFAVCHNGLFNGESMPILPEHTVLNYLKIVGMDGWKKGHFQK